MTKGKRRGAPKQSASASKSHPNPHKQNVPAIGSEEPWGNPALVKHTTESKDEVLECSATLPSNSHEVPRCKGEDTKQLINGEASINSSDFDSSRANDHQDLETDGALRQLISNEELMSSVDSPTSPAVYNGGCENDVQETNQAPQFDRLSIESSPLQYLPSRPDGGSRFCAQAGSEDVQDNSREQNIPQITITTIEESQGLTSRTYPLTPDSDDDTVCKFSSLIYSSSNMFGQSCTNRTCSYGSSKRSKRVGHLSKILTAESLGTPSESSDGNRCGSSNPELTSCVHLSDFWRLKETTEKLHLSTRRPSTMLWRQQYMDRPRLPTVEAGPGEELTDENLTTDRKQRIDDALEWLRNELQDMRSQDQNLARQLLTIRQDIHQLKLQRSTEEHQELIEDFQSELDDLQEFSDVLDLPQHLYGNNPLKHVGVTRLNISARRFSAC